MTDFRRLPILDAIRYLETHGEPPDPRPDIDTASLIAAFPELGSVRITDLSISGRHGDQPARMYRVPGTPVVAGFVWAHGGAFFGGHLDMPESHWVGLSLAARGISVLAVDYAKALNGVRFPVPSDDVLAGWEWATENAEHMGVRRDQISIGGASAGGNLVAGVVARLRDAGAPLPATEVLVYPKLYPTTPAASAAPADGVGPDALDDVSLQIDLNFVGSPEGLRDPYAFPGLGDASGLPPVYILNSETDSLRGPAEQFGTKIAEAGGRVLVEVEPGARHGHLDLPYSPEGQASVERLAAWLTGAKSAGSAG